MRRGSRWFVVVLVAFGLARAASADPFGGFGKDGSSYLVGGDRICAAVASGGGAPTCRKAADGEASRLGLAKGTLQRGAGATISAEAAGAVLRLRDVKSGKALAEWTSPDAIARVSAVFISPDGKRVAVEYDVRVGGRAVAQAIVVALPAARSVPDAGIEQPASGPATPTKTPAPAPPPAKVLTPAETRALATAVKSSDRLLAGKKWALAEAGYRKALAIDPGSAPARFGLAAALARRGVPTDAIAELDRLARSADPNAPVWLVEARSSAHFAALRADAGFRRAVGIDPDPTRPPSAFERLVGQGGAWEQPGQPCQDPTVALKLDRVKRKFVLKIATRCQGDDEVTTLDGVWNAEGGHALALRFPNPGGPDETLECELGADASGEDSLTCVLEDIAFTMRVVRR